MPQKLVPAGRNDPQSPSAKSALRYLALVPPAIVVAALYFGRPVLLPLAVAVLLAFALAPLVAGLRRIRMGRIPAVLTAAVSAIIIMLGIGAFVATRTVELANELPRYETNLIEKIQSIRGTADETSVFGRLTSLLKDLREQITGDTGNRAASPPQGGSAQSSNAVPVQIQSPESVPLEFAASFATSVLESLMGAVIIIVFVIFILLYKEDIRDRFIHLIGSRDIQRATLLLDEGAERLGRYLLTQTAINAGFGIVIAVGTWLVGIPNPALWGVTTAILRFVPYIGVPLAAVLPVLLALAVDSGWSMAVSTAALFAIGEMIVGQIIEPWAFGRELGLSPPAIVIAATFWTWLWGPIGLLLATPLTVCLVVLGRHMPHLRFLDVLLGDQPPLSAEEALYIRLLGDDAQEAAAEAEDFIKDNSLVYYFDEVVLRALQIAQADLNRGALEPGRIEKIRNTTETLIRQLSEDEPKKNAGPTVVERIMNKTESIIQTLSEETRKTTVVESAEEIPPTRAAVLCVSGRGPLDEAATLLLVNLLEQAGVPARVASRSADAESGIRQDEIDGVHAICLSYLDSANVNRARYVLRRLRRRNPNAVTIAAFWGHEQFDTQVIDAVGCDVVTRLDEAVDAILAVTNSADIPPEPAPATSSDLVPDAQASVPSRPVLAS